MISKREQKSSIKTARYVVPFLLILLIVIIMVKCAVNPVTGKKELMLISQNAEVNMGKEIDQGIRMEYGLYHNPQLKMYIEGIGKKLIPYTHRPNLEYHFAILDTPVVNAFAAPGGYIYVTRGLLALMNSEAELASVLGHELGHVSARHSARQMTRSIIFTLGIALASELSEDFRKVAPISFIAGQLLFLKYGRNAEHQSDSLGIEYAIKAGYNSQRMVDFFSSLQNMTQDVGGSRLPNFLSTHPLTGKRVARVNQQFAEHTQGRDNSQLKVARAYYLGQIDGLIYGKNPRQGYIERGVFYHPDMAFSFRVPNGWKVENTARQVTMAPKGGTAAIIFQAEETDQALDAYTRKMMASLTSPQIQNEGFRYINGFNSFHTFFSTLTDDGGEEGQKESMNVDISCIRKGKMVFTFFSAAKPNSYYTHQNAIHRTVDSFRRLSSRRHLSRKPKRLYVRKSRRAQTLRQFLLKRNIPSNIWNKITLINSMPLSTRLSPNQPIKIIK
jgi:predicted Zn-dependent protease